MRKKALLALMLAASLLLSGCALIVKDEAVDNATEILRLGDQVITKGEVKQQVDEQLYYNAYLNSMYGSSYDTSDPANIAAAQNTVIDAFKRRMTVSAKAKELGLDALTEEELEKVKTDAKASYDSNIDYAKKTLLADSGLEGEALEEAALKEVEKEGLTLEKLEESTKETAISDKVREYVIKDVSVSDEEIQTEYDTRVENSKTSYPDAGSYATAVNNGTTVYYAPAGVRRIQQILTKFKDEDQTVIDEANKKVTEADTAVTAAQAKVDAAQERLEAEDISVEDKEDAEADKAAAEEELAAAKKTQEEATQALKDARDAAFANLDADADALLASLQEEGADWDAIMKEKNQDPGMERHPDGYAVAADMVGFDPAFVQAAMALENVGDISGKVRGESYGYYILRYAGDEPEGAIALDTVKDSISSSLLTTKQNNTYNDTLAQWVEAAGIKVDLNALKD